MISRRLCLRTPPYRSRLRSLGAVAPNASRPYHLTPPLHLPSPSSTTIPQPTSPPPPPRNETYIPAPTPKSGPLLSRLPNRALPPLPNSNLIWLKTAPLFIVAITLSALALFNYQKSSSSTVNSVLYALRTNDTSRELLGEEIYFASKVPWIRGRLDLLHGSIDVGFWVKGTRGVGWVRYVSVRRRRGGKVSTFLFFLSFFLFFFIHPFDNGGVIFFVC
jgi:cytochrome c oxidase assembly factor 1